MRKELHVKSRNRSKLFLGAGFALFLLLNSHASICAAALQGALSLVPQKEVECTLLPGTSYSKKESLDNSGDLVTGKVYFEYKINIKKADKYTIWSAGMPTDTSWASPFFWAMDETLYQEVKKKNVGFYNEQQFTWTRLGECSLKEGEHILRIKAIVPRVIDNLVIHSNEYYLLINEENYVPFAPDKLTQETDIWIEGEDFTEKPSPFLTIFKSPGFFAGATGHVYTQTPPAGGFYRRTYEINVPSSGDYQLWILSYPADYEWSFDGGEFKLFKDRPWTNRQLGPENIWYNVTIQKLEKGKHTLALQVTKPFTPTPDGYYLLGVDAILLTQNGNGGIIPLDVSSKAKYQIAFEQIKKGNIFQPGESATIGIITEKRLENAKSSGNFLMKYVLKDWQEKELFKGEEKINLAEGTLVTKARLNLKNLDNGLYSFDFLLQDEGKTIAQNQTSIAVIPKEDKTQFNANSIFGAAINYWELYHPSLPLMHSVGIKTIRTSFQWREIQPAKDKWDWEKYDKLVAEAKKYNFNLMPFFYTTPDWASSAPESVKGDDRNYYPPKDYEDWKKFVSAVINRYKDYIKMWEIWNEPWPGGYAWHSTTETYRELLKSASEAAKKADPTCKIAAYDWPHDLYKNGCAPYFDADVFHPYNDQYPLPEQAFLTWCKDNVPLAKQYNHEAWITEHAWGWSADITKANYAVRGYTLALAYGVKKYCWFDFNSISGVSAATRGWGLMNRDTTPQIGFVAYNTLTSMLEKKVFLKKLDLKPDVWCFLFKEDKQKNGVAVLWSTAKEQTNINFAAGSGEVYDIMYRALPKTDQKTYQILLSESPIFVKAEDIEKLAETIGVAKKNQ